MVNKIVDWLQQKYAEISITIKLGLWNKQMNKEVKEYVGAIYDYLDVINPNNGKTERYTDPYVMNWMSYDFLNSRKHQACPDRVELKWWKKKFKSKAKPLGYTYTQVLDPEGVYISPSVYKKLKKPVKQK
jgi:hypothetical protein